MLTQQEKNILEDRVVQVLKTIYDPEIPINIYELGLIYEAKVDDQAKASILMTLTAPNCPVAEELPIEIHDKIRTVEGISECVVVLTFEPAWDKSMISDIGLLELGML